MRLVGRDRELHRLRSVIDRALAGRGQTVLLAGEAGIGKTTLTQAIIEQASARVALALPGHCYDLTTTPPYGPWLEILSAARQRDAALPLPDALADRGALASAPSQDALYDAFATFFRDVAARQPLVLILEDMHWADQASLDLLRYVARRIDSSRVLTLVTYRDDEITRRHPLFQLLPILVREALVERLSLRRLDTESVRQFVTCRHRLTDTDADRLTRYLYDLSDGNPFFVRELLTALEDDHILRSESDRASLGDLGKTRTPPLLKQVIERRLARLNVATRDALEVAAVIGQDIPLSVWLAVLQQTEEHLDAVVEEALEHRVLEESADGGGWRFTHALVREALHEGIALIRRRRWHRRAAEILAALPSPDPDAVAYHFQQAGDARAADWLIQAGERAQRSHAWFSAADRFEVAAGMLEATPERDRERGWLLYRISQLRRYLDRDQGIAYLDEALAIASGCGDEELAAATLLGRGLLKCFAGDLQVGLSELEMGTIAAERLGGDAASGIRPGGSLNRGVYALWLAYAGRFSEAITAAKRHLAETTNPLTHGGSHRALAVAHSFLGQPDLARQSFARAREIATATHDRPNAYISLHEELTCLVLRYYADKPAELQRLVREVAALRNRARGTMPRAEQSSINLTVHVLQGNWDDVRDFVADPTFWTFHGTADQSRLMWDAMMTHHRGHADGTWRRIHELLPNGPVFVPSTVTIAGFPMLQLVAQPAFEPSDLAIARSWLESFDRWLEWSGAVLGRAENAVLWAQHHQATGDLIRARELASRALAHASNPRQPLALIAAYRVLGQIDTVDGRHDDADRRLRESLALADACAVPYDRALALLALAELDVARGNPAGARALLGEVVTICEPLAARPALDRAEGLLARLDARGRPADERGGLSAREIEVLRLVAKGMIDREIAAALFISPRTVTTHVTHILDKLGVNTRTEAAALAVREELI
jgi:DNA-binding CsgD family transcriptional regulator